MPDDNEIPSNDSKIDKVEEKASLEEIKKNLNDVEDDSLDNGKGISAYMPVYQVKMKNFHRPIYIALFVSGILAWFTFQLMGGTFQIDQETPEAAIGMGFLFGISSAVSSIFIAFIVKRKGEDALKYIMGGSFMLLTFMLLFFYGDLLIYLVFYLATINNATLLAIITNSYLVFCLVFSLICIYMFFMEKMGPKSRNIYVLSLGILIGAFMASNLGTIMTLTILIFLSIWDFISVKSKRGPIRQIMEATGMFDPELEEDLKNNPETILNDEDFKYAEIEIGIGDISFYSMLTSHSLIVAGQYFPNNLFAIITVTVVTAIGILLGSKITINALKKNKILPGLPLSIIFGIVFGLIAGFSFYILK